MSYLRSSSCLLILSVILLASFVRAQDGNNTTSDDNNSTNCDTILVRGTWWNKETVEGAYKPMKPEFQCANRTVYKMMKGDMYIYFVQAGSWQGWVIGAQMCRNSGTVSVGSSAWFLDDVSETWEEYAGFTGWHFNEAIKVGCHGTDGKPLPPRLTTTTTTTTTTEFNPNASTTTVISTTTTAVTRGNGQNTAGPRVNEVKDSPTPAFDTVLYIVIPVGCVVMLILVVVVALLFIRKPPYHIKEDDEQSVQYDAKNGRVRSMRSSSCTELVEEDELDDEIFEPTSASSSRTGSLRVVHRVPDLPPRRESDTSTPYSKFGDKLSGSQ